MKTIPLTRGHTAVVDNDVYEWANKYVWQAHNAGGTWRVKRGNYDPSVKNNRNVYLAREILKAPPGVPVDHVNGNPFDNRRRNLRLAPNGGNQKAFRRKSEGKSSQFRGVLWHKQNKKWWARLQTGGKQISLGTFNLESAAARAYDTAAKKYFGEFACLNFPNS